MKKIDKRLFRMIKDTKGQFVAVCTVLIVGLVIYMTLSMSSSNLEVSMIRYYSDYNFADLSCSVNRVNARIVRSLEDIDGVIAAEGRVSVMAPLLTGDGNQKARVNIITYKYGNEGINNLMLEEGSLLPERSKDILLIKQLADARGIKPGDKMRLQIGGRPVNFTVSGIVLSPEFVYLVDPDNGIMPDNENFGVVYMDEWLGQQLFGYAGNYNDIQMLLDDGISDEAADIAIDKIEKILKHYGSRGVVKRENQMSNTMISEEIKNLKRMSSALPILFLLIAALTLAMMLGRMVKRDRQPIGVMKALGYSTGTLMGHYVKYTLLVACVGGIIGIILGVMLTGSLTTLYMEYFYMPDLDRMTNYEFLPLAFGVACVFCVTAGLFGTRGITKITPTESMRIESPKPGKKIFLEHTGILWRSLTFSSKMAMKNVFRNKRRSLFVVTGVLLTFGMVVFVFSMPKMMSDMMGTGLSEFQTMDYNVNFKRPISEKALFSIKNKVNDVEELEGKIEYPFKVSSGQNEISLSVIGIDQDSLFYSFKDKKGNSVVLPDDGVLVSDFVANKLRVGVGDRILFHSYLSDMEDEWEEVRGIVTQALGVNAYMNRDVMAKKYFTSGVVTGFYMNSDDAFAKDKLTKLPIISSVSSMESIVDSFTQQTQLMNTMIFFMLALSGVLGFAVVYNATIISIGERETEFSSLRVLGFSRGDIFRLILKENNVITAAGIIAGIPLANLFMIYASDMFSTEQYSMILTADPVTYIQGLVTTVFFIVLAQFATYQKIKKLDFMAAIKNRA